MSLQIRHDGLLAGKVVLLSGVGPGLGQAIARSCAAQGASVAVAARTPEKVDAVVEEIVGAGGTAMGVAADVTDADVWARIVEGVTEQLGGIDCLVHNAYRGPDGRSVESVDLDRWRKTFEVNVFAALALTQAVLPVMRKRGGGSVVFVNSMASRLGPEGQGGYAASKGALLSVARTLAREVGGDGIRVNSVVPGWIWGPGVQIYCEYEASQRGVTPEDIKAEIAGRTALGKVPPAEDVAGAVVFFASELSAAITGVALDVNGGEYFG